MTSHADRPKTADRRIALASFVATLLVIAGVAIATGNGDFARFFAAFLIFLAATAIIGVFRRRGRISVAAARVVRLVMALSIVLVVRAL